MKHSKHTSIMMWVALGALLVALGVALSSGRARAQNPAALAGTENEQSVQADKTSPDLKQLARDVRTRATRTRVIVELAETADAPDAKWNVYGARVARRLEHLHARVLELSAAEAAALAEREDVRYVSLDRESVPFGHISLTSGADAARNLNITNLTGFDGTGIGIAVLDSGMDLNHLAFNDRGDRTRILASRDFTGENRIDDPYGHGTHVTSIAAGNGRIASGAYIGIAPNANLINLRVLNKQGTGLTSNILAALDWVLQNRTLYNIRVVNMSLGAPTIDSYRNDPLCRAVRRLVDAGIVVVAAAGNNGKDSAGNKIYGAIHAPGDEPAAITVGASNTFGTDARADDGVTTYSSRGPTRGSWLDAAGVRHYDSLLKPDLVAPGNKIVDAEADDNLIIKEHPELDAGVSGADNRKMMFMNGTSMATPVVAGAVALMLQANPALTPNMVKMILMYTAQPLANFNMLEQGAGEVNIEGAVRLAKLVRPDLSNLTPLGAPLLTAPAPDPHTTIANYTFVWSQGLILNRTYATGTNLVTKYQ
ncbi:MAG TPA: S8 family peptidase, partial [Pyrinomonadaceae bacterium]|nr:S8 family peptidase [Pyrinomonadaceae bacterium]